VDGATPRERPRRLPAWLLHLAVAVGLLALVVWRANLWDLGDEYSDFDPGAAIAAVLLNAPVLLLMTVRGQLILGRMRHRVPFLPLFPISTVGNVVGSLTPGAAGDLLRTPFFKDRHDIAYGEGLAAVIYERGFSVFVLALSTGAAAAWMSLPAAAAVPVTLAVVVAAFAGPPVGALVLLRLRSVLPQGDPEADASFLRRGLATLGRSVESLLVLLRDPWATAAAGGVSLSVFALMAVQMWLVVRALGFDLSPAESWTALGASLLAGILTLLPLGLGTLDATLAAVIGAAEGDFSSGTAAAVLLRATVTLPMGLAAFASYLYLVGRRPASGRRLDAGSAPDKIGGD
jgi:uncharacterized protein (TIRG00374 family)